MLVIVPSPIVLSFSIILNVELDETDTGSILTLILYSSPGIIIVVPSISLTSPVNDKSLLSIIKVHPASTKAGVCLPPSSLVYNLILASNCFTSGVLALSVLSILFST